MCGNPFTPGSEHHGCIEQIVDPFFMGVCGSKSGWKSCAIGIGSCPDVAAIALEARGFVFEQWRVGKEGGCKGGQTRTEAHLSGTIGLG